MLLIEGQIIIIFFLKKTLYISVCVCEYICVYTGAGHIIRISSKS